MSVTVGSPATPSVLRAGVGYVHLSMNEGSRSISCASNLQHGRDVFMAYFAVHQALKMYYYLFPRLDSSVPTTVKSNFSHF